MGRSQPPQPLTDTLHGPTVRARSSCGVQDIPCRWHPWSQAHGVASLKGLLHLGGEGLQVHRGGAPPSWPKHGGAGDERRSLGRGLGTGVLQRGQGASAG
jgi:hypothetical protein